MKCPGPWGGHRCFLSPRGVGIIGPCRYDKRTVGTLSLREFVEAEEQTGGKTTRRFSCLFMVAASIPQITTALLY